MATGPSAPARARFAALFDWDGVIIDSSRHHEESWERLAAEHGYALPPGHFRRGFGMKNEAIIPGILGWTRDEAEIARLSLRKEELYRDIVRERGCEALPGARALLDRLRESGVPCAIASSTHRLNIRTILALLGLADRFQAVISAEDVKAGKPAPDVFLAAARALGRAPAECLVFEDALVGIEAARRGGMKVVAVATTHPLSELGGAGADLAVPDLAGLDLARLGRLFA